jgi:oligopeptide/dipeptide ABC transporter ATP-binding protein
MPAVDDVSLTLGRGEAVGLVGESGCGKTTLARCIVRLVTPDSGRIIFDGREMSNAAGRDLRVLRRRIQMIYQDPYSSLNPRLSVFECIQEAGKAHGRIARGEADSFVRQQLDLVGLPSTVSPKRPRELSGGQRQRVAIARALAVKPEALIADEAVSALDVSVQAQILNLFDELKRELGLSVLFIAHQLSVVAHLCDRVNVMYLGQIVEAGTTENVFRSPKHPYTIALLRAHPDISAPRRARSSAIVGEIEVASAITGCRFQPRCPVALARCVHTMPPESVIATAHVARCLLLQQPDDTATGHEITEGGQPARQQMTETDHREMTCSSQQTRDGTADGMTQRYRSRQHPPGLSVKPD